MIQYKFFYIFLYLKKKEKVFKKTHKKVSRNFFQIHLTIYCSICTNRSTILLIVCICFSQFSSILYIQYDQKFRYYRELNIKMKYFSHLCIFLHEKPSSKYTDNVIDWFHEIMDKKNVHLKRYNCKRIQLKRKTICSHVQLNVF